MTALVDESKLYYFKSPILFSAKFCLSTFPNYEHFPQFICIVLEREDVQKYINDITLDELSEFISKIKSKQFRALAIRSPQMKLEYALRIYKESDSDIELFRAIIQNNQFSCDEIVGVFKTKHIDEVVPVINSGILLEKEGMREYLQIPTDD